MRAVRACHRAQGRHAAPPTGRCAGIDAAGAGAADGRPRPRRPLPALAAVGRQATPSSRVAQLRGRADARRRPRPPAPARSSASAAWSARARRICCSASTAPSRPAPTAATSTAPAGPAGGVSQRQRARPRLCAGRPQARGPAPHPSDRHQPDAAGLRRALPALALRAPAERSAAWRPVSRPASASRATSTRPAQALVGRQPAEGRAGQMDAARSRRASSSTIRRAASTSRPSARST